MKEKSKKICNKILICVSGNRSLSIMSTMKHLPKNSYIEILLSQLFSPYFKDTTQPYSPTGKQVQGKPTPWKDLNTKAMTPKGVLCQEVWKKYSCTFNNKAVVTPLSW